MGSFPPGKVNQHTDPEVVRQFAGPQQAWAESNGISSRTQRKLDRLARDRPDLLERVQHGEQSAHRATVEAGIIRVPMALEVTEIFVGG